MVVHACNPHTHEAEAEGYQLTANLAYTVRPCLRGKEEKEKETQQCDILILTKTQAAIGSLDTRMDTNGPVNCQVLWTDQRTRTRAVVPY